MGDDELKTAGRGAKRVQLVDEAMRRDRGNIGLLMTFEDSRIWKIICNDRSILPDRAIIHKPFPPVTRLIHLPYYESKHYDTTAQQGNASLQVNPGPRSS